jgi:uncharacterized metal-binding protein YceD (DUF177 family)
MDIDLSLLHSETVPFIDISGEYDIDKEYYKNSDIIGLSKITVNGKITRKENDDFDLEDYIDCTINGDIILSDSISLEEVKYPFSIEYDDFIEENCVKNKNTLDIFLFLWENIVLEVPLQFTKVEDLSKFHGDGWKLISEDELKFNNSPFSNLLKDFEEE